MTLNDLLEKGYFPKELPPPFNTKKFSHFFETKSKAIFALKVDY